MHRDAGRELTPSVTTGGVYSSEECFMNNKLRPIGIIALVAVIFAFTLAGCENGTTGGTGPDYTNAGGSDPGASGSLEDTW